MQHLTISCYIDIVPSSLDMNEHDVTYVLVLFIFTFYIYRTKSVLHW